MVYAHASGRFLNIITIHEVQSSLHTLHSKFKCQPSVISQVDPLPLCEQMHAAVHMTVWVARPKLIHGLQGDLFQDLYV